MTEPPRGSSINVIVAQALLWRMKVSTLPGALQRNEWPGRDHGTRTVDLRHRSELVLERKMGFPSDLPKENGFGDVPRKHQID